MQIFSYGLQPYYGYSNQDVVELIRTHQLLTCPAGCPPRLYTLLVDCWHRVPSSRPNFDVIRCRLRNCATGSGSIGSGATTAGCCVTDGLYQPQMGCPPAACLQYDDSPVAQFYPGPAGLYNVATDCPPPPTSRQNPSDESHRWPATSNGDAVGAGTDEAPGCWAKPASSSVDCGRPCSAVHRSTTSTSASTTPRNSHHQPRSSSSSASDAKSRRLAASELDRLTSHPRPR